MVTEELLSKINDGLDKVEELNEELATSLYGGDTGYRGYYDEFWDAYQDKGARTNYNGAFAGVGWGKTFKPKYPIKPATARNMFYNTYKVDVLDENVISIDFSKCTDFVSTFMSGPKYIDIVIDTSGRSSTIELNNTFSYSSIKRIKKLIVDENVKFTSTFIGSAEIEELIVDGVIGQKGFNIPSGMLNRASIESIIDALSTTTSGLSITLSRTAVNNAFETSEGLADGSSSTEWLALVSTKPNWTISLA